MSEIQQIWLQYGEKWANYIFEAWIMDEETFLKLIRENEVFSRLSFSSYYSMVTLGKCVAVESLPLQEKRELWNTAKIWCPDCTTGKQMMTARLIHLLITIGERKIKNHELLPSPTEEKS